MAAAEPGEDVGEAVPAQGGDGQDLGAAGEGARLLEARAQPGPVHEVDLVQRDHGRQAGLGDRLRDVAVARAEVSVAFRSTSAASTSPSASSTAVCMRRVSESNGFWNPGRSSSTIWQSPA